MLVVLIQPKILYMCYVYIYIHIHTPSKMITVSFFVCGINLLGLPKKTATWLPEIISGESISMGLPER